MRPITPSDKRYCGSNTAIKASDRPLTASQHMLLPVCRLARCLSDCSRHRRVVLSGCLRPNFKHRRHAATGALGALTGFC